MFHPPSFDHPNIIWIGKRSPCDMSWVAQRGAEGHGDTHS
jgi:hypothetical protein